MSTTELAKTTESPQKSLKAYLENNKGAIAQVLPSKMTADRMLKVVLSATLRTPKLLECSQVSILQSVMHAAQLGLEAGSPLGHAYLVPFFNKDANRTDCQLIVGYRGLIDLARRGGEIKSIEARCVYKNDEFTLRYGLKPQLEHAPCLDDDPGELRLVYAIAHIRGSKPQVEVMTLPQVERIRKASKSGKFGPWAEHFDEMARKTVVRRLCKYLPLSIEAAEEIAKVDMIEAGEAPPAAPAETTTLAGKLNAIEQEQEAIQQAEFVKDEVASAASAASAATPAAAVAPTPPQPSAPVAPQTSTDAEVATIVKQIFACATVEDLAAVREDLERSRNGGVLVLTREQAQKIRTAIESKNKSLGAA